MWNSILKHRDWKLRLSILNRRCYATGISLKLSLAYRGRKKIHNPLISKYCFYDDVWLSKQEYFKFLSKGYIYDL